MSDDEVQIRRLVEEKFNAVRDKDPKTMVAAYVPKVVMFASAWQP